MKSALTPPEASEYAPFYAGYIATVLESDVPTVLARQPDLLQETCAGLTEEQALHRYAPEKWSVKEVVGHLVDAERIFAYRALRIGRGDVTPLAPFDENLYVSAAGFDRMPLGDLVDDFATARRQTLAILRGFDEEELRRIGTASSKPVSARALFYIMAGHVRHHLRLLDTRYGLRVPSEELPSTT
jgi:hypothetical protein